MQLWLYHHEINFPQNQLNFNVKKKVKMAYAIQCSSTYQVKWMKRVSWGWGTQLIHY